MPLKASINQSKLLCQKMQFKSKKEIRVWHTLFIIIGANASKNRTRCPSEIVNLSAMQHFIIDMTPGVRKPAYGVSDKVRLKPACPATETRQKIEISLVASLDMILSNKRTTKAQIRMRGCADWSAPLLFAKPPKTGFLALRHIWIYRRVNAFLILMFHQNICSCFQVLKEDMELHLAWPKTGFIDKINLKQQFLYQVSTD